MKRIKLFEEFKDSDAGMGRYNFLKKHLEEETKHYDDETDPKRKGEYKKSIDKIKARMSSMS